MNKKILILLIIILVILAIVLLLLKFYKPSGLWVPEAPGEIKISDIVLNPSKYDGKTVTLDGKYGGWSGNLPCDYANMAMKTRSDAIFYDETGCIYMAVGDGVDIISGGENINPMEASNVGEDITVQAVVTLIDGRPILGR